MRSDRAALARSFALLAVVLGSARCSSASREGGTNTNWICSSDSDCVGAPGPVCREGLCVEVLPALDAQGNVPDASPDAPEDSVDVPDSAGGPPFGGSIEARCERDLACTPGDGGLDLTFSPGACSALPSGCEEDGPVLKDRVFDRCEQLAYRPLGGTYCGPIRFDLDSSGCVTRFEYEPAGDAADRVFEQCALAGLASFRWPCSGERDFLYRSCTIP